jgi:hypothetical protein
LVVPLQYYRDYSGDIDSLAQQVYLPDLWADHGIDWPATCPKEHAQEVMLEWSRCRFELEVAARDYTYTFENAASGKKFKVILGAHCTRSIQQGEGGQVIRREEKISLSRATLRVL